LSKFASLPPSLFKREREPFRIALFDRRHYLAIHPDGGVAALVTGVDR
jgi:hypothetical protein